MRRRQFIAALGGAAIWPSAVRAQQVRKIPRLGILNPGTADPPGALGFYGGLRELGYTDGQNIAIGRRYGNWLSDRFGELAAELVRANVDVIVVMSTSPARAAKEATNTIPIVGAAMADPVGDGLVASLVRPGGNVTGTTFLGPELTAKRMGLLKEAIPTISRVAVLWHPGAYGNRTTEGLLNETKSAALALGWHFQLATAQKPNDLDAVFSAITAGSPAALVVLNKPDVLRRIQTHRGFGSEEPFTGDVRIPRVCGRWGPDGVRSATARSVPECCYLCGQNSQRSHANRPARAATDKV